jgi:hypothetical protein
MPKQVRNSYNEKTTVHDKSSWLKFLSRFNVLSATLLLTSLWHNLYRYYNKNQLTSNYFPVWDLQFSQQCFWRFKSSGMWCVLWHVVPSVSKCHCTFISCVTQSTWNFLTIRDEGRVQLKCDGTRWRKGWRSEGGNWRMELVASTLHTTSEHGVSSITTTGTHTSAASSRLNWRPPADLDWLVHFAERRNLVSTRVPSHFERSLTIKISGHNYWNLHKDLQLYFFKFLN